MTPEPAAHRARLVAAIILVAACAATYARVPGFDFVNWDDDLYVTRNMAVQDPGSADTYTLLATPYLGYPIPVTMATYTVEHALFDLEPAAFHLTNLLLHGQRRCWSC